MGAVLFFLLLASVISILTHFYYSRKVKQLLEEIESSYSDSKEPVILINKVELKIHYGPKVVPYTAELLLIKDNLIILPFSPPHIRQPSIQIPSSNNQVTLTKARFTHVADNIRIYHREIDLHSYRMEDQRWIYIAFTFRFADEEQMKPLADHLGKYYAEFIT